MTNVTRPTFNPTNGRRIRYDDSPAYDPNTGRALTYGEDRRGPAWNQETGLPASMDAQVNLTHAGTTIPVEEAAPEVYEDDAEPVTVTRIMDQGYEDYGTFETAAGQTVAQIRRAYAAQLSLTDDMIAVVNGVSATNDAVVEEGSNVVFKAAAKRRG